MTDEQKSECLAVRECELFPSYRPDGSSVVPLPSKSSQSATDVYDPSSEEESGSESDGEPSEKRPKLPEVTLMNMSRVGVRVSSQDGRLASVQGVIVSCSECNGFVDSDHYDVTQKCSWCTFETSCVVAMQVHSSNAHRACRRGTPNYVQNLTTPLTCSECLFSSRSGNEMGKTKLPLFLTHSLIIIFYQPSIWKLLITTRVRRSDKWSRHISCYDL